MSIKSVSIRIDEEMLNKLHVVADYEGRSLNSQVLILIRESIAAYEERHGKIGKDWKKDALRGVFFASFYRGERPSKHSQKAGEKGNNLEKKELT